MAPAISGGTSGAVNPKRCLHCKSSLVKGSLGWWRLAEKVHCVSCRLPVPRSAERLHCPRGCAYHICSSCVPALSPGGGAASPGVPPGAAGAVCSGCGEDLSSRSAGLMGRTGSSRLCDACYSLGAGEGGMVRTASERLNPGALPPAEGGAVECDGVAEEIKQFMQSEGHATVRVFSAPMSPRSGSSLIAERPNGSLVHVGRQEGYFMHVRWQGGDGWVGMKNLQEAPAEQVEREKALATVERIQVKQAEGFASVRVFATPADGAAVIGEIPSGEYAAVLGREGSFVQVQWNSVVGWIGVKNVLLLWEDVGRAPPPEPPPARMMALPAAWFCRPAVEEKEPPQPPRLAAAGHNFRLPVDEDARERWATFSQPTNASPDPADAKIIALAKQAAPYLNFLQLSVMSQEELNQEQQRSNKQQCLELYSPYASIPMALKGELIAAMRSSERSCRSLGCLVGMAVGDALGAPFEFLNVVDVPGSTGSLLSLEDLSPVGVRNKFRTKPGQWTDDSSMGLCLADTLLARGTYSGADSRIRYHNWWFRGYNNAFGNDSSRVGSIGLGGNVSKSLRSMRPGEIPPDSVAAIGEDAGNGTIMRLAPVPLFYAMDPVVAAQASAKSSDATHPGRIASAACAFQGFAIAKAIGRGPEPITAAAFLDATVTEFLKLRMPGAEGCEELVRLLRSAEPPGREECWNWRADALPIQASLRARGEIYNGYPCVPSYYGSYCIDGLAVALWSFYHTNSFLEAVVRCVNFLGDADTVAAICGQIAGAFYGYDAISQPLIDYLEVWDNKDIAVRAALLYATRP
eukprot:TRINITY_DN24456_c0_g1_i1.p1 TRINITY_DN24456_c0_g1~~TRINITY_DN24456_c0_g1_i1.p1  ORF type:complete len:803 (+),score=122.77 TRINITY_DN24456_c0_g1_i1:133-2541(+)